MQTLPQSTGLEQLLTWKHAGGSSHGDKLVFAALASSVAASPLLSISYRARNPSVLGTAAAAAAAGLAYRALPSSVYAPRALSPVDVDLKDALGPQVSTCLGAPLSLA